MSERNDPAVEKAAAFLDEPAEPAHDTSQAPQDDVMLDQDGNPVSADRQTELNDLGERIINKLRDIYDPEIPVNIYDLGLIYKIDVEDDNAVRVDMTLTSPHCPVAETLPEEVKYKVETVDGVNGCTIDIVWEPPWNPSMMTEEAQLELGMIY
ncbi:MAG: SUF system Fe-S cluster assembly protein [Geminicoccaceae bacterium]